MSINKNPILDTYICMSLMSSRYHNLQQKNPIYIPSINLTNQLDPFHKITKATGKITTHVCVWLGGDACGDGCTCLCMETSSGKYSRVNCFSQNVDNTNYNLKLKHIWQLAHITYHLIACFYIISIYGI